MLAPSIITAVVIRKQQQQLQQQHQQEKNVALHLEIWNIRICAQHKHYSSIYRSGWGACSSRIMSSVQIYGTTLAPGTIIQTLISFILDSRDICIVVHSHIYIRIANQPSLHIFFSVRFVEVRWGSYLILVYPFKCVANSTSLNNNSVCQKLLTLPTSLSKWVSSAQGYGSLDLFYLYVYCSL